MKPNRFDHNDALEVCINHGEAITPEEKDILNRVASSWACDCDMMVTGDLNKARGIVQRVLGA